MVAGWLTPSARDREETRGLNARKQMKERQMAEVLEREAIPHDPSTIDCSFSRKS